MSFCNCSSERDTSRHGHTPACPKYRQQSQSMTPLDLEAIRERLPGYDWKASHRDTERALISIIDLQTRALLAAEVTQQECGGGCGATDSACAVCDNPFGDGPHGHGWHRSRRPKTATGHREGCPIDAALTACGLDTHEKRDAARKAGR